MAGMSTCDLLGAGGRSGPAGGTASRRVGRESAAGRNGVAPRAGGLLGGQVRLPEVGAEDLVLDVAGGDPAIDERAPDGLHERQGAAEVVAGVLGKLDVVEVHDPGM